MGMGGMGMGGMGGPGGHRPMSEINVTPLVDIMLVLLIIFMVAAPLLSQGVEVNLPEADAEPLQSDNEPLVVSVDAEGKPHMEGRPLEFDKLAARIEVMRRANPRLTVFVRGDQEADYGAVMQVMAALQQAGVKEIGLVTEPGNR